MRTTRVVLADDHPVVRTGIRHLLEKTPDIEVVGEASNGVEALRLVNDLTPDVLLLDIEMPDMTGVEVARQLKAEDSSVHILILSAYNDKQYIEAVLASGAAGYLTKEEAPQRIIKTIIEVVRGEKGYHPD
jgi:DNA-binding NarL/FixJ family response regulator